MTKHYSWLRHPARRVGYPCVIGLLQVCLLLVVGMVACMPTIVLPEVDLSAPGWKVYNGQARWRPKGDKPSLAGELIAARHANGDVWVDFSKSPFPLFTARKAATLWRIDFIERGRSYSGRGQPPRQFIWFFLPDLLEGAAPPQGWQMTIQADGSRLLFNPETGEELLVVIDP